MKKYRDAFIIYSIISNIIIYVIVVLLWPLLFSNTINFFADFLSDRMLPLVIFMILPAPLSVLLIFRKIDPVEYKLWNLPLGVLVVSLIMALVVTLFFASIGDLSVEGGAGYVIVGFSVIIFAIPMCILNLITLIPISILIRRKLKFVS